MVVEIFALWLPGTSLTRMFPCLLNTPPTNQKWFFCLCFHLSLPSVQNTVSNFTRTPEVVVIVHSLTVSDSLQPHGLQNTRLPCPSPSPGVCSNSCALNSNHLILCHPLLLLPSVFPSIRVFFNESALPIGGQSTGASASASVLPMNIQS